jgi:predicted transcriptional regulator
LKKQKSGGKLTPYAKRRFAIATYEKGRAFLFAALLLREKTHSEAQEYVIRHLVCQGVELISKATLLFVNYDKYMPLMERHFRHNIRMTADEALAVTKQKPLSHLLAKQLDQLSHFYSQHLLRYGGLQDIFINPDSLTYELIVHRACAGFRLITAEIVRAEQRGDLFPKPSAQNPTTPPQQ